MKKFSLMALTVLLAAALLAGCDRFPPEETTTPVVPTQTVTEAPTEIPTEVPTEAPTEIPTEAPAEVDYTQVYREQIDRYYVAMRDRWELGQYFENEMSELPFYYYDGNPLDNAGYCLLDMDKDGSPELVIGAILNAQMDPAVFELWTLVDGAPVMLAQGFPRNRFCLQYSPEADRWTVANEGSNGAANSAVHYLAVENGAFTVVEAVILDAWADEANPWFLAYDMDWDVSDDIPIDEETAIAIQKANRSLYTAAEYIPFRFYE